MPPMPKGAHALRANKTPQNNQVHLIGYITDVTSLSEEAQQLLLNELKQRKLQRLFAPVAEAESDGPATCTMRHATDHRPSGIG